MLVQVQWWDGVAVLCLRSDLVVVQDVAVSAQGGSCSSVAAAPLHSMYVAWDSLLKLAVVVALVGESVKNEWRKVHNPSLLSLAG